MSIHQLLIDLDHQAAAESKWTEDDDDDEEEEDDEAETPDRPLSRKQVRLSCASIYGVVQAQVRAVAFVAAACGADLLQELRCEALNEGINGALDGALTLAGLNSVLERLASGTGSVLDPKDLVGSTLQNRYENQSYCSFLCTDVEFGLWM
jgi:hypothetical protein